jgi:hypothetical protein
MPRKKKPELPTISEAGESIIQRYDPDLSLLRSGPLNLPITPIVRRWSAKLNRPDGDFYYSLFAAITPAINSRTEINAKFKAVIAANMEAGLLVAAALDRRFNQADSEQVKAELKTWLPVGEMAWRELELMRAVNRAAAEAGIELPQEMRDERAAWGRGYLRDVVRRNQPASKAEFVKILRARAKTLKKGSDEGEQARYLNRLEKSEPEIANFLRFALMLSHWDVSESELANELQSVKASLRADIRNQLQQYRKSLIRVAAHIEAEQGCYLVPNARGEPQKVGQNGKLQNF